MLNKRFEYKSQNDPSYLLLNQIVSDTTNMGQRSNTANASNGDPRYKKTEL